MSMSPVEQPTTVTQQPKSSGSSPGHDGGHANAGYSYNAKAETTSPLQPSYPPGPNNGNNQPASRPAARGGRRQPEFMQRPPSIPGVPAGLEYLTQIDQLLIHQQIEVFEALTGIETSNRYQIKNTLGQQVYFAGEESDSCMRQCCGPQRGFTMHITDNFGQEVIRVRRDFKCVFGCNCCAGASCCSMEVTVEAPVGQTVGFVRQQRSCMQPIYAIQDAQNQTLLKINGPSCICPGPCDVGDQEFVVIAPDSGEEIGKISKQWSGFVQEYFTDADNFGVNFPMDMDVRIKAVLIGAVFLIDFMFFENNEAASQ